MNGHNIHYSLIECVKTECVRNKYVDVEQLTHINTPGATPLEHQQNMQIQRGPVEILLKLKIYSIPRGKATIIFRREMGGRK